MHFAGPVILQIEAGDPLVVLAGAHVGCFELFGTNGVRAIRDLKGRTVGVPELGGPSHVFLASLLAHVGLDPRTDVTWATHEGPEAMRLLADGKIDGYLGFPPEPQELRARRIGQVVVNSLVDRPWSQYFCCMVIANRDYVATAPRRDRAGLARDPDGVDVSGRDPDGAVRYLVEKGYTTQHAETLEAVKTIHASGWRGDYDPEDTLRYYALRLHEAGMIKSSPDKIIARGTDWRFLAEVKRDRGAAASAGFFCPDPPGRVDRGVSTVGDRLIRLIARVPVGVHVKLVAAFLTIVVLLITVGALALTQLTQAHSRAEELYKLQRKIAAYRQLQNDTTAQLYTVASALLVPDERTLAATLRQLSQFGYDFDRLQFVASDEVEVLNADPGDPRPVQPARHRRRRPDARRQRRGRPRAGGERRPARWPTSSGA